VHYKTRATFDRRLKPSAVRARSDRGGQTSGSAERGSWFRTIAYLVSQRIQLVACLAALVFAGCSGSQSADEKTDALLRAQGLSRVPVYPLAGRVTVDGQPPQSNEHPLIVMLNDVSKPDIPFRQRPHVQVKQDGQFAFDTYAHGDGVCSGKYVVTIARFTYSKKKGLLGPDQLKNLYNDPDKNSEIKDFVIDHHSPGQKNYLFALEVAGKEPLPPGPHALIDLSNRK
jgi:hypothetical protein